MSRYDPVRVVVVTAGLALAGAVVGAFSAVIALATVIFLRGDVAHAYVLLQLEIAGGAGATLGMISAPVVVWGMLRRVPLGRVFLRLTLGTVLGGVLGWFAFSSLDMILGPTIAAFVGFMASAVALSFREQHTRALTGESCARLETQ